MTESPIRHRRLLKWSFWVSIVAIFLLMLAMLLLAPAGMIKLMGAFDRFSPTILIIRYSIFALLWFKWASILRVFYPAVDQETIKQSRRPIGIGIIAYEAVIWMGPVLNWLVRL